MVYQRAMHLDVPVTKVFDFFRDPRNLQGLNPGVMFREVALTDEGIGTRYAWASRLGIITLEGSNEYTEFVPNRRITDRSSSALEGTWTYSFEPEGSGTRLTLANRSRSIWAVPPLRQLLDWVTSRTHGERLEARLRAALSNR